MPGSIKLRNYQLLYLLGSTSGRKGWLDTPVKGRTARSRNRVVKLISEKAGEYEKERITLCKTHADKDENDKPIKNKETGVYAGLADNKKFQEAFNELVNDEIVFDVLPSNEDDWRTALVILDTMETLMNTSETEVYEVLMTQLEEALVEVKA